MNWRESLRSVLKAGRKRNRAWVRLFDVVRLLPSAEGRARLWTKVIHGGQVHQTTPHTGEDRYPNLFDMAASQAPDARRILSFGCSTGEELVAIRTRFPKSAIVGVEINPRARSIAAKRVSADALTSVVGPNGIEGDFDLIFALAVLQREPHKVCEMELDNLVRIYPFERFDAAVSALVERLNRSGLLCVINAQYPIELSSAASQLEHVSISPEMTPPLFGRDSRRLRATVASTIFRKRS